MAKSFLANLNDRRSSIDRAVKLIAARLRNTPDDNEDEQTALQELARAANDSLSESERTRLASFELWSDRNLLPDYIAKVSSQIIDFASARRAVEGFSLDWFKSLPLSSTGKQELASVLLRLTTQYNASDNNFWHSLVDGNAEVLSQVAFNILENTGEGVEV